MSRPDLDQKTAAEAAINPPDREQKSPHGLEHVREPKNPLFGTVDSAIEVERSAGIKRAQA